MNDTDPFITRTQARKIYFGGVDRKTLWVWEKRGKVPPAIRLSRSVQGWRKSTLEAFITKHQGATNE